MSGSGRGERPEALNWVFPTLGLVFGLCLAWSIGFLEARESYHRERDPRIYAEGAKDLAKRICIRRDTAAQFECVYQTVESSAQSAHDKQDLSAQQRAASSAGLAAIAGIVTLGISVLGLIYVKRTLDATREANLVSRRNGEAQVRCYLSVSNVWVKLKGRTIIIYVRIKNSGQSPALDAVVHYGVFTPDIITNHTEIGDGIASNWKQDIPVTEKFDAAPWHFPRDMSDVEAKRWSTVSFIAVNVRIRAIDVFDLPVVCDGNFTGIVERWDDGELHELSPTTHLLSELRAEKQSRVSKRSVSDDHSSHPEG